MRVQPVDVGNAGMRQAQQVDAVEERRDHPRPEQLDLPREQQVPDRMVLGRERVPVLRDDIVFPAPPSRSGGGGSRIG